MRHITFRILVAVLTFSIGVAATTVWLLGYHGNRDEITQHSNNDSEEALTSHLDWKKVDMEGKVSFYIPPNLKPDILDTPAVYRAYRNQDMEIRMFYNRVGRGATCIAHSDEKLSRNKVLRIQVAGKPATQEVLEDAVFGLRDFNNPEPFRGVSICVPSINDGEHEFAVLAKYKNEQAYESVKRIIASIKFL